MRRDCLIILWRDASQQGWPPPQHSELPEKHIASISFEAEAAGVRNDQSLFTPGLLRTEEYVRAVIRSGLPLASQQEVENHVQARNEIT